MRTKICWIALFISLCLCAAAQASSENWARSKLTKVYGWTPAEAEGFHCETAGKTLRGWPEGHPDWVYTMDNAALGAALNSPFDCPAEGVLRTLLQQAAAESWFTAWGSGAKKALAEALTESELRPNLAL